MNTEPIHSHEKYPMDRDKSNYLEQEFYDLLKHDNRFFELMQSRSIDGISYSNLDGSKDAWFSSSLINLLRSETEDSPTSMHWLSQRVHPQNLDTYNKLQQIQVEHPSLPSETTLSFIGKNDTVVRLQMSNFTIESEGKAKRLLSFYSTQISDYSNTAPIAASSQLTDDEGSQFLFEHSRIGLGFLYSDETWGSVNQELCKILEQSDDQLIGQAFHKIFSEVERYQSHKMFNTLYEGKYKTIVFEKKILTDNHKCKWLKVTLCFISEHLRSKFRFMVNVEDISEHRHLENKLRSKENTTGSILTLV
ncbi:hypothetical protein JCM19241_4916 [Vibrio ishigakensis]|uniref:Uncharacterized protein n=1 Tax=Vibrio ishigakensis TaxID=1481914 RepID=A0A0B8QI08_9VIBR|nr:hypothetical protein JCM19241_4916 [Vibrio ishigakensis]